MDRELLLFFQIIKYNLKHSQYEHVMAKHKKYKALVAGVGLDDMLKQYVRRENSKLFEQRVNITRHVVTAVCKNLLDIFYKVPRSNSARRIVTYSGEDATARSKNLEKILSGFWGSYSWDDYMATRFIELNSIDPNSFVAFEFDQFDSNKERAKPYPFEISCDQAINFKYDNGTLQYLVSKLPHDFKTRGNENATQELVPNPKEGMQSGHKYTFYGKNQTYHVQEVDAALFLEPITVVDGQTVEIEGLKYVKLGDSYYQLFQYASHGSDRVPAFRVGYIRDLSNGGASYVNPLDSVEPYLEKTIKTNSELDLVATLLAMPQPISYGKKCPGTDCFEGYTSDDTECSVCKGSGAKSTSMSAQDAIVIAPPEDIKNAIPLDKLIYYSSPEVDIVKWQEEYIDKLTEKAKQVLFNTDTFSRKQVAETATGKNLDIQNVYDTLHPLAVAYSKIFPFGVKVIAGITDLEKNLITSHNFGKDFKMKSLDTLLADLEISNRLDNASLTKHINDDIAQIIFSEKPLEYQRYQLREMYNPFAGKTKEEIFILISGDLVTRETKILYSNFSLIFDRLELEYHNKKSTFYALKREEQREKIYEQVNLILEELEKESPEPEIKLI